METSPYEESGSKDTLQSKLDRATLVLQNINAYFLLIDKDFIVCDTNYYSLNKLPAPETGVMKRVGDLLYCRNAAEAGECGMHQQCKLCGIRAAIGRAFQKKESFKKVNASMNLLNEEEDKVIPCDVSVSGAYVVIEGEEHMVLTVYDVTELQNVQRLLNIERKNSISAERLKSTFIANISHEVRTPLNAIVGFSGLIATASDEEEKKLYMDIISENNERLLRLINDIFDLSQIEAGTLSFEYSEFDANDLLRELEGMFQVKLFNNPSVDLICEASLQPIIMYSEHQRIIQVMANLIHNAIKFTKSGEIRFGCYMKETDTVHFYVSDTGIGIPEEEQQEIFTSFKKLDREVPGTGLGLTLSQTIIRSLGGKAGLESEVNKGSTFWFEVPLNMK